MIECAVVVLNWNGVEMLKTYLPTLIKHSLNDTIEIIVADNCSSDSSVEFLKQNFPQIRVIEMDNNRGFAEGYNVALKEVKAKYFLLLNSDVEVTDNWLTCMLEVMNSDESIWACAPKIKDIYKKNYFEYAGASGGFIDYLGYPFCRGRILDTIEEDTLQYDNMCDVFWVSGAAFMVRRERFLEMGGFDADYFAHMEEIDLCWRMNNCGGRVVIVPQSEVYHVGGATLNDTSPYKTYLNFRNNLSTLYKNTLGREIYWYLFMRIYLDFFAAINFILKGKYSIGLAALKGHFHFWRNIGALSKKRNINKLHSTSKKTNLIYSRLLIWQYYARNKRTYKKLQN